MYLERIEELEALLEEIGSEAEHGVTLINELHFGSYIKDFCIESFGDVDFKKWPFYCIDWEHACAETRHDYLTIVFDGTTFYYRSS